MQFINKHKSKIVIKKVIIGGNIMIAAILIKIDFVNADIVSLLF